MALWACRRGLIRVLVRVHVRSLLRARGDEQAEEQERGALAGFAHAGLYLLRAVAGYVSVPHTTGTTERAYVVMCARR